MKISFQSCSMFSKSLFWIVGPDCKFIWRQNQLLDLQILIEIIFHVRFKSTILPKGKLFSRILGFHMLLLENDWYIWSVYSGHWSYIHTIRKPKIRNQVVEVRTQLTHRDYLNMLAQKDDSHFTIFKKRRCFLVKNQYFQLDIYREPCHPRYVLSAF